MTISKEQTNLMKGYAILFIFLHNFLHMRFCQENEMTFSIDKSMAFFQSLVANPSDIIWNVFSFIGWVGVPVFCFVSGYGLSVKHKDNVGQVRNYVCRNYLKLFLLLFPALLLMACAKFVVRGDFHEFLCGLVTATMLQNLVDFIIPFRVLIYWYFGLTFQFYLLYILFCKINSRNLLFVGGITIIAQLVLNPQFFPNQSVLVWIRHNSVGWLMAFVLGIVVERWNKEISLSKVNLWIISILSFILMLVMNLNYYSWIFVPFVALMFFYSISRLTLESKILRGGKILPWLGKYSSCIFVCHPIVRLAMYNEPKITGISYKIVLVLLYVVITLLLAFVYNKLITRLNDKILNKI